MDIESILNYRLFTIGSVSIEIFSVLFLVLFIVGIKFLLYLLRKLIYKSHKLDESKKYALYSLIKYTVTVVAIVLAFDILGFKFTVLLAGSAALLVGIGLGLQNLFSDFVSGIILLVDGSIKVGDVIEVNNMVCKVTEINLRTTTVLTRDEKFIIVPNTILTKNQLINWTHHRIISRFDVSVGVGYNSDIRKVSEILLAIAKADNRISSEHPPFTRLDDFAASSLNFTLHFWVQDVYRVEGLKSDLRIAIFEAFQQEQIEIPFPQRVVYLKNDQ